MLGEATLHVSRTFAGERNTASHSVCRPAKALPWGLWHPILMQFYSGPLMHLLSGVDSAPCRVAVVSLRAAAKAAGSSSALTRVASTLQRPIVAISNTSWTALGAMAPILLEHHECG